MSVPAVVPLSIEISDRGVGLLCLAILIALVVRTALVYRATGRFPIRIKPSDSVDDYLHFVLVAVLAGFFVNLVLLRLPSWLAAAPGTTLAALYDIAGPFAVLEQPAVRLVGVVVAAVGLALGALAQHQMGASWRVGIDRDTPTDFVRHGLFAVARHPIYLAFIGVGAGLFLAMPSALTAAALAVMIVTLGVQARLEEAFMRTRHGEAYAAYLETTRRWL